MAMARAQGQRPPRIRIVTGPPEGGVFRETWAKVRRPFVDLHWHWRMRWLLQRGVTKAHRWRNPPWVTALYVVLALLTLIFAVWGVRGLLVAFLPSLREQEPTKGWDWTLFDHTFNPDQACTAAPTSCGAATGVFLPVLALATSIVIFLVLRLWSIRRYCLHQVKKEPTRLVQTAGSLLGEVVGRDQLCNAIMNNLRERETRRAHVVVGKVGSGKTALLVRLAQKLAVKGAVPIPIRLRDADKELDFCCLARTRFEQIVSPKAWSDGEVDRMWRWLRQRTDRIVILADGLEEALNDDQVRGERDNMIRDAIRKANDEGVPLVIASRPHDPLRAMQAAVNELEPLNEEAALAFIRPGGTWRADPTLLDRVVEGANMAESPLYMRVARDLHAENLLEPLWTDGGSGTADSPLIDGWALREDLLSGWVEALANGMVCPELPIARDTRWAVIEYISALACIGLASDSADIALQELDPTAVSGRHPMSARQQRSPKAWTDLIAEELDRRLEHLTWEFPSGGYPLSRWGAKPGPTGRRGPWVDAQLAATWGNRMGLITETGRSVRFQHSVIQAYLGSRFLGAVLRGNSSEDLRVRHVEWDLEAREYAARSLGAPGLTAPPALFWLRQTMRPALVQETGHITEALNRSGRELLMAFTLHSRSPEGACTCNSHGYGADSPFPCPVVLARGLLVDRAKQLLDDADAAETVCKRRGRDLRQRLRLDERGSPRGRAMELYGTAVEIDSVDTAPVQKRLIKQIEENWQRLSRGEDEARLRESKIALVQQCGHAARRVAALGGGDPGYEPLFHLGVSEEDYRVRAAIVQETGAGETSAFRALYQELSRPVRVIDTRRPPRMQQPPEELGRPDGSLRERRALHRSERVERSRAEDRVAEEEGLFEWQAWHRNSMRAWLLPMLVQSARLRRHLGTPRDDLEKWVDRTVEDATPRQLRAIPGSRAALGTSLAQGFKYAANRRPSSETDKEAREFLMKQAQELLRRSSFWYTRLTLLQALTLWELPDDVTEDQPMRGHRSDPKGKIDEWLALGRHQQEHPLVEAAGRLAVRALQTRRPERFLWIDEVSAASQIGTEVGRPGEQRAHNLWIAPSTGWSTLDPQAQQLLADVLLLLGLGERGYRPKDLFRVLSRSLNERPRLPSCLSRDRSRLDPLRPMARACEPGTNCTDECRLKMCPYPSKVEHLRLEFSEVFCMRQRELLMPIRWRDWRYLRFRREARWQRGVPVANMRRFWAEMGDRARDIGRDEDSARSGRIRR